MDPVFPVAPAACEARTTIEDFGPPSRPESVAWASRSTICDLRRAARRMASIHDGIRGQSIPPEVTDFYKAIKNGDNFRPRMAKEVVRGIEEAVLAGYEQRPDIEVIVRGRVEASVAKLPHHRLDQWLQAMPAREQLIPCNGANRIDRMREGYVREAMDVFKDALDYTEALARS